MIAGFRALLSARAILIAVLLVGVAIASVGHASNQCAEAFIGESRSADLAADRTQEQLSVIISEIDSILRLPEHVSLDGRITKLIDDRVVEVLSGLGDEIRQATVSSSNVLSGQGAKKAAELSRLLERDLESLAKKTATQKSIMTKLMGLVPRMLDRQIETLQRRVGSSHHELDRLISEINRDDEILRDLEIVLYEKRRALNEHLDVMKSIREELQKRLWHYQQAGRNREVAVLNDAIKKSDAYASDLVALTQLLEGTDKNVKITLKVNSDARSSTIRIAKTMVASMQASGRLDLSKAEEASTKAEQVVKAYALESSVQTAPRAVEVKRGHSKKLLRELRRVPLEEIFEKLKDAPDGLYFKVMNDRVKSQKSFSFEELLALTKLRELGKPSSAYRSEELKQSHYVYERAPFTHFPKYLRGDAEDVYAFVTLPVRLPVVIGGNLIAGRRFQIRPGQHLLLIALNRIDVAKISRDQWEQLKQALPQYTFYRNRASNEGSYSILMESAKAIIEKRLEKEWSRQAEVRMIEEIAGGRK